MDVLNPIYTEKAACQDCYKCVRQCTVKAIRVEQGRAAVVKDLCVLCGHCVEVCPVGAKKVRNDLSRVKKLLGAGRRVIASVAPSYVSEFPHLAPEQFVALLRKLGFWAVSETALGADLVSYEVARQLRSATPGTILISSACPTVVEYLHKYKPALARRMTAVASPLLTHARYLQQLYGSECAVVFIGPCISKKWEADTEPQLLSVAIDFEDLRRWIEETGLHPQVLKPGEEDRFMPQRAGKGTLYPIDGGMIAAVKSWSVPQGVRCMSFSGIEEINRALDDLEGASLEGSPLEGAPFSDPIFLELLACEGGCVNGPRSKKRTGTIKKRFSVLEYAQGASNFTRKAGNGVSGKETTGFAARGTSASGNAATDSATIEIAALAAYRWDLPPLQDPVCTEAELLEALRKTGKFSQEDELNCGGCGYDTCRDFARAMLAGRAEPNMCVSYMRKLAQKKANGLIQSIPSGVVIVDNDLHIVECNYNFARIAGEEALELWEAKPGLEGASLEKLLPCSRYFRDVLNGSEAIDRDLKMQNRILHATIFGIERGACAGGVFHDITAPWVQKDRVVTQARKVITKNLAVVQKIAFLLGENAAETEATLNSIIDSFEATEPVSAEKEPNR
ncbi:MAG: [Fe-Fe] hydrogenase large subunit C-terminal domain-containing protein [Termitinemataceae bacterium]